MIDNFNLIIPTLHWDDENDFYFIQILKRKKENPELGSNSYVVKTYYITSLDSLEFHKDEMIQLAEFHNARVCINLNRRNFEKCSLQTARLILDQIANKDYKSSRKAFNSICGKYSSDSDKKWIIDIDSKGNDGELEYIRGLINECQPVGEKILLELPTKNGIHLITKPFNIQTFNEFFGLYYDKPEIHKNNPTILYI